MASFSLEIDDRTEEEREKDRAIRNHQANERAKPPMDSVLQEDLGYVHSQIRINPDFAK